jgi:hypothetical protein
MTQREATLVALKIVLRVCHTQIINPDEVSTEVITDCGYGDGEHGKVFDSLTQFVEQLEKRIARLQKI